MLHNILVRMSQNNIFGTEGFCQADEARLVSQLYDDGIAKGLGNASAECTPCAGQGSHNGPSSGHDLGNEESAESKRDRLPFMHLMATKRRMTSETEHMAMRRELVQPVR